MKTMKGSFYQKTIALLHEGVRQYGSASALARASGVSAANLSRWLHEKQAPRLADISLVLDVLGVEPAAPRPESGRDVCFAETRIAPGGDGAAPPPAEDYIAAPLVGEVGAGPGRLSREKVKSWFLVCRNLPAVRYRRNLIAVEIDKYSTSMQPLLNPLDIVLVDRDDRDVSSPGHIMLVLDPGGRGMIKRVCVEQAEDGDFSVVYYSDNAIRNPPVCLSLRKHFLDDWDRAIVGRVIWAWSDVREK